MKGNPLAKDLLRSCWLSAILVSCWAFMIITLSKAASTSPLLYSLFVGARFYIVGLVNVALLKRSRWVRYAGGYVLSCILCLVTTPLEFHLSGVGAGATPLEILSSIVFQGLIYNTLVIIIQSIVILRFEKTTTVLENSKLKAASLESANMLLRQQIQPHFLFNALSMLKSLYKTDIHAGEAYLSHLVNFLRASIASPEAKVSLLGDELKLCNDYLEMQKIRFEDALFCTVDVPEGVAGNGYVPSFAVQSLIENAIKHNEVTEASPLKIKVFYREGCIITENNLQPRTYIEAPSGRGLINLMERYKLLCGGDVIIHQDEHTFSVSIKVLSDEYHHH